MTYEIHGAIAEYIRIEYKNLSEIYRFGTETGLHKWLLEEQNAPPHDAALFKSGSFLDFVNYLSSAHSSALKPVDPFDASHPISNYFISSSHNTYLTGNQLSSEASINTYKNVRNRSILAVSSNYFKFTTPDPV